MSGVARRLLPLGLLLTVLILVSVFLAGALSVHRAGSAVRGAPSLWHFFIQASVGLLALILGMRAPLQRLERIAPSLFVSFAVLALAAPVLLGENLRGRTYLSVFGWLLDPAAGVVFFATLYMAWFFANPRSGERSRFWSSTSGFALSIAVALTLLLAQPNAPGFILFFSQLFFTMLLFAPRARWPILLACIPLTMALLLYPGSSYRLARLSAFMNPWDAPMASGFQLMQSLLAIGRGGWTGVGFDEGLARQGYLPEVGNVFLTAHLAEEFGVLILIALLLLLLIALTASITAARRSHASFSAIIAISLTMSFVLKGALNIGVITGLTPTIGVEFPLSNSNAAWSFVHLLGVGLLIKTLSGADGVSIQTLLPDLRGRMRTIWQSGLVQAGRLAVPLGRSLAHPAVAVAAAVLTLILGLIQLLDVIARFMEPRP